MGMLSSLRKYGYFDHHGDRYRFFIGDIKKWEENESGFRAGREFGFEIGVYDQIGEFDKLVYGERHHDSRWYLSHWVALTIWRWSISLTVRGKRVLSTWGALPDDDDQ